MELTRAMMLKTTRRIMSTTRIEMIIMCVVFLQAVSGLMKRNQKVSGQSGILMLMEEEVWNDDCNLNPLSNLHLTEMAVLRPIIE